MTAVPSVLKTELLLLLEAPQVDKAYAQQLREALRRLSYALDEAAVRQLSLYHLPEAAYEAHCTSVGEAVEAAVRQELRARYPRVGQEPLEDLRAYLEWVVESWDYANLEDEALFSGFGTYARWAAAHRAPVENLVEWVQGFGSLWPGRLDSVQEERVLVAHKLQVVKAYLEGL